MSEKNNKIKVDELLEKANAWGLKECFDNNIIDNESLIAGLFKKINTWMLLFGNGECKNISDIFNLAGYIWGEHKKQKDGLKLSDTEIQWMFSALFYAVKKGASGEIKAQEVFALVKEVWEQRVDLKLTTPEIYWIFCVLPNTIEKGDNTGLEIQKVFELVGKILYDINIDITISTHIVFLMLNTLSSMLGINESETKKQLKDIGLAIGRAGEIILAGGNKDERNENKEKLKKFVGDNNFGLVLNLVEKENEEKEHKENEDFATTTSSTKTQNKNQNNDNNDENLDKNLNERKIIEIKSQTNNGNSQDTNIDIAKMVKYSKSFADFCLKLTAEKQIDSKVFKQIDFSGVTLTFWNCFKAFFLILFDGSTVEYSFWNRMCLRVFYENVRSDGDLYCFETPKAAGGQSKNPGKLNQKNQSLENAKYLSKLLNDAQKKANKKFDNKNSQNQIEQ